MDVVTPAAIRQYCNKISLLAIRGIVLSYELEKLTRIRPWNLEQIREVADESAQVQENLFRLVNGMNLEPEQLQNSDVSSQKNMVNAVPSGSGHKRRGRPPGSKNKPRPKPDPNNSQAL
jgi:hypothetical protein